MRETTPPQPGKQRRRLGQSLRAPAGPQTTPAIAPHAELPLPSAMIAGASPAGLRRSGRSVAVNPIARPAASSQRPGVAGLVGGMLALVALPIAAVVVLVAHPDLGPVLLRVPPGRDLHAIDLALLVVAAIGWFKSLGLTRDRWRRRQHARTMTIPLG